LKLILHSDQNIGLTTTLDQKIIPSLCGKRSPRIGYLPSCPDPRRKAFQDVQSYYGDAGFKETNFWDPGENDSLDLRVEFFKNDLIHLAGGQVKPSMDRMIGFELKSDFAAFLKRGGVLLGLSAGAMILGPTLGLAALFGEKFKGASLDGLGFVSFEVVPHWSEMNVRHKEVALYSQQNQKTVFGLNDGEVILVNGAKTQFLNAGGKAFEPIVFG
jgi:dipeptidase E